MFEKNKSLILNEFFSQKNQISLSIFFVNVNHLKFECSTLKDIDDIKPSFVLILTIWFSFYTSSKHFFSHIFLYSFDVWSAKLQ